MGFYKSSKKPETVTNFYKKGDKPSFNDAKLETVKSKLKENLCDVEEVIIPTEEVTKFDKFIKKRKRVLVPFSKLTGTK